MDATTAHMPFEGVIDADGHILEPPDLWETYLESKYQDRALRIQTDEHDLEYLEINGKKSKLSAHGTLGFLGGMGKSAAETIPKPERTYVRGAPFGAMNAKERVQLMDQEGTERRFSTPHSAFYGRPSVTTRKSLLPIAERIISGF